MDIQTETKTAYSTSIDGRQSKMKKKKTRMTLRIVNLMKKGSRESFDEELGDLCDSWKILKKLSKFVRHKLDCNLLSLIPLTMENGVKVGCTCGLEELLKQK